MKQKSTIDIDELVLDIKRIRNEVYALDNMGHYPWHIQQALTTVCSLIHDTTEKYKTIQRRMK